MYTRGESQDASPGAKSTSERVACPEGIYIQMSAGNFYKVNKPRKRGPKAPNTQEPSVLHWQKLSGLNLRTTGQRVNQARFSFTIFFLHNDLYTNNVKRDVKQQSNSTYTNIMRQRRIYVIFSMPMITQRNKDVSRRVSYFFFS